MNRHNVNFGWRGVVLLVLWIAARLLLPVNPVAAHAFLESSEPAANAILPTAPQTVTLTFTEPLETSYSRAELFDQTGAAVPGVTSTVGSDPRSMSVVIPPGLANGTYSLLWRTLSTVDGHTAQGYLPFTIGTQADVRIATQPAIAATAGALPESALSVARWLALLGLAAVAAIWPTWLFVVRPAISPAWQLGPKLTRRVRGFAVWAFVFALLANVVALVVQAAAISGLPDLLNGLTTTLGDTRYGTWWLVRMGVLLVFAAILLGVAWWRPWQRRPATLLALIAGAALPLPFSMISHAGAEPAGQATAVAFDYVHLLGASIWAGGLLFLLVALGPTVRDLTAAGRRVVLGRAIPRFSLLALFAWGVMGVTGLYSAWLQVGNIAGADANAVRADAHFEVAPDRAPASAWRVQSHRRHPKTAPCGDGRASRGMGQPLRHRADRRSGHRHLASRRRRHAYRDTAGAAGDGAASGQCAYRSRGQRPDRDADRHSRRRRSEPLPARAWQRARSALAQSRP